MKKSIRHVPMFLHFSYWGLSIDIYFFFKCLKVSRKQLKSREKLTTPTFFFIKVDAQYCTSHG